jgi:acetyl esterase/lipase
MISGGWVSAHELLDSPFFKGFLEPLTNRGYTVFAVCHGCQPKFQIPEIVDNINRSVRFIRYHAKEYGIDPNRIGVTGGSAGGHLSLMQGLAPQPPKADAPDPIDRVSSKVQAVACFFPPTDFLNWGKPGANVLDSPLMDPFRAAFDFHEFSAKTHRFERISDVARISAIEKQISPIYAVSADDPPTLISHGDLDVLVPIEQSQRLIEKLRAAKVPAELIVRHGRNHGWGDIGPDMAAFADWFDRYLSPAGTKPQPAATRASGPTGASGAAQTRTSQPHNP